MDLSVSNTSEEQVLPSAVLPEKLEEMETSPIKINTEKNVSETNPGDVKEKSTTPLPATTNADSLPTTESQILAPAAVLQPSLTSSESQQTTSTTTAAVLTPNVVNVAYTGNTQTASLPQYQISQNTHPPGTKYNQLLALIEELGKEIRPTYTGNRNSTEKLKRAIGHARILARECVLEVEKNARQQQLQQQS